MSAIREFLDYIRAPYFSETKDPFNFKTLPVIGKLLGFKLLLIIAALIFTTYFLKLTGTEEPTQRAEMDRLFTPGSLILVAVLVPILEELFFRSWLRKRWGVKYIFPIITLLTAWMLARFFQLSIPRVFGVLVLAGLTVYMFWVSRMSSEAENEYFVDRIFPYAFWISTLAFALIHLTNFNVEEIGVLGILVVLPQFFSGAFLGYIVKRYGFWAAVSAHGFWNGTIVSTVILLSG